MKKQKNVNFPLTFTENPKNYVTSFRQNIDMLMEHHDMTLRELSEKADISFGTLSNFLYDKEAKDCKLSTAVKIARAFNVSLDEIVGAETMEPLSKESLSLCRQLPAHFVYLVRAYIRHVYKLYSKTAPKEHPILVMLPECRGGHLQTTNITASIDISHLHIDVRNKVAHGLKIPCEHYEPYFMPDEIILLAVDRDGLDNEICVISNDGNYYIVRKKQYLLNGNKKWKYISLFTEKEFLKEEIDDKLGYVVGFLNADKEHSWGIR